MLAALQRDDLGPGRSALDLGCGTGMLALGCALVDCDYVLGVECDQEALQLAIENTNDMEMVDKVFFILAKVKTVTGGKARNTAASNAKRGGGNPRRGGRGGGPKGRHGGRGPNHATSNTPETMELILSDDDGVPLKSNCVDTVLTNPPFGTKDNAGMDVRFLRTATRLARRSVYSFHKSSTRDYLVRKVQEWGMTVEVVAQMKFDLPQTYKFHKEKSVDIEVDLLRVMLPFEDGDTAEENELAEPSEEEYEDDWVDDK